MCASPMKSSTDQSNMNELHSRKQKLDHILNGHQIVPDYRKLCYAILRLRLEYVRNTYRINVTMSYDTTSKIRLHM